MAITRAQQSKQMLQDGGMLVKPSTDGKRPGYRSAKAQEVQGRTSSYSGKTGKEGPTDNRVDDRSSALQTAVTKAVTGRLGRQDANQADSSIFYGPKGEIIDLGYQGPLNEREEKFQNFLDTRNKVNLFGLGKFFQGPAQAFSNFNASINRPFFEKVIRAGKIPGLNFGTVSEMTKEELEEAYQDYMSDRLEGKTDAYGNPNPGYDNPGGDGDQQGMLIPPQGIVPAVENEPEEEIPFQMNYRLMADGGRAALAEGGMPYEGGIMDLESSRQMYGLGKLVKKVTRSVKKIAKSPIGKAALLAAGGYYLGGGSFLGAQRAGMTGFKFANIPGFTGAKNFIMGGKTLPPSMGFKSKGLLDFIGGKFGAGILGSTIASYFMTPEEEQQQTDLGADIDDPQTIMNDPYNYLNMRNYAEGGEVEPVAKKTMPLLDMDGQEMDLRAEGGFVPLGRMERADDVPARLSKNEFVFTADAVRNAGEGDVDKGAEVMYNMMKNLESGGEVSEESQGLEGAREMFQTSQRLEEVI